MVEVVVVVVVVGGWVGGGHTILRMCSGTLAIASGLGLQILDPGLPGYTTWISTNSPRALKQGLTVIARLSSIKCEST